MKLCKYEFYNSKNDYHNHPVRTGDMKISRYDISKFAILNGSFNGNILTYSAKGFYTNICKMALEGKSKYYVKSSAYELAEKSYKTCISFSLGMLSAQLVANKKYGITRLFHLDDTRFRHFWLTGKNQPDFIGIDKRGNAFLFESKGSSGNHIDTNVISEADGQLRNIRGIIDRSTGKIYTKSNLKRHIVASCFKDTGKTNSVWHIQDIDPDEIGKKTLEIDLDEMTFVYYKTFIDYFDSLKCEKKETTVNNIEIYTFTVNDEKYCISRAIYDELKERIKKENDYSKLNSMVNEILVDFSVGKNLKDKSWCGDGILVCGSEARL